MHTNLASLAHTPRIGFSTNVFDNPKDITKTTKTILRDFSDIEIEIEDEAKKFLFAASPKVYDQTVTALIDLFKPIDGQISVHAPYASRSTDLASPDQAVRKSAIEQVRQSINFCADIGGDRVTYHPGFLTNSESKTVLTENLKRSIEILQQDANRRKILLCLENMGNDRPKYLAYTPEEHRSLHRETGTWVTLDLVHLATWCHSLNEMEQHLEIYAPITRNIHFNDMPEKKHRHIPPGDGILPLAHLLKTIYNMGYTGAAIVDEFARPITPDNYLSRTKQFVEAIR